ncbi:hypothetical protein ACP4OV_031839 [Aristida adscensionis]
MAPPRGRGRRGRMGPSDGSAPLGSSAGRGRRRGGRPRASRRTTRVAALASLGVRHPLPVSAPLTWASVGRPGAALGVTSLFVSTPCLRQSL